MNGSNGFGEETVRSGSVNSGSVNSGSRNGSATRLNHNNKLFHFTWILFLLAKSQTIGVFGTELEEEKEQELQSQSSNTTSHNTSQSLSNTIDCNDDELKGDTSHSDSSHPTNNCTSNSTDNPSKPTHAKRFKEGSSRFKEGSSGSRYSPVSWSSSKQCGNSWMLNRKKSNSEKKNPNTLNLVFLYHLLVASVVVVHENSGSGGDRDSSGVASILSKMATSFAVEADSLNHAIREILGLLSRLAADGHFCTSTMTTSTSIAPGTDVKLLKKESKLQLQKNDSGKTEKSYQKNAFKTIQDVRIKRGISDLLKTNLTTFTLLYDKTILSHGVVNLDERFFFDAKFYKISNSPSKQILHYKPTVLKEDEVKEKVEGMTNSGFFL